MSVEQVTSQTEQRRAVIYCRVSGTKQATNGHGLESQESRCREHAITKGYEVEAVFPDDVSGGGDFMNRPGMVALLSYLDAQKHKSYVVIFDDLKRFARDTEFHIQLRRAFKARGAQVECLNFKFEDTPEGKFIETIIAAQGELEREQNGRQTRQKMLERVKKGYWVFRAPFGFRYEKTKEHGKLLVRDEPVASIIQEALEGFAAGRFASQAEVQRFLQNQPEYPKGGNGQVHSQRVADLMSRSVYAGLVEHAPWGVSVRKGHHIGIISPATYEQIQNLRNGGKRIADRADRHEDFVLRGAVCCADCQVPFRSAWSKGRRKRYAYYVCQTKTCDSYGKSIPRAKLEGAFEELLVSISPTPKLFGLAVKMFKRIWDQRLGREQDARRALRDDIKDITKQTESLLDRMVQTENTRLLQSYEARFNELELSRLALEEKITKSGASGPTFEESLEPALAVLSSPWKLWQKGSYEIRRTVLKLVLTSPIHYHRDTGARTAEIAFPFKVLTQICEGKKQMVPPHGLEPRTY